MALSGDVPPHSLEAERSVLGALLLDDQHMAAVHLDEGLRPEDFYRESYGAVFAAMIELHDAGRAIDWLTVEAQMRESGAERPVEGVEGLAGWVPAAGHAREYARRVHDLALRRALLVEAHEIAAGVYSGAQSARELIEGAEKRMLHVADSAASDLTIVDPDEEIARLAMVRDGVSIVGVPTGFIDLDRITAGLHPGNLVILAARPSMGKSALAVNIAEHVADKGHATALFSLEMSRQELLRRMIASRARVPGNALLRGPLSQRYWERALEAIEKITGWPLYVDDGSETSVLGIRAKARRLAKRVNLSLVIVDYLQLMRADAGAENRNIEVGNITRGLKILAKELKVPVLCVSQLSRQVEHRQDKHPVLADLRDSGSVEQDADVVLFLYRAAYYDPDVDDPAVTELNIAKHRNGALGQVLLTFLEDYPRFANHVKVDEPLLSRGPNDEMPF